MPLCLALLALLTLVNLRGVRSTGIAPMLPTCSFVLCLFALVGGGLFKALSHTGAAPAEASTPTGFTSGASQSPRGWRCSVRLGRHKSTTTPR